LCESSLRLRRKGFIGYSCAMAKSSNDLFANLRTYISKVAEGERTPAEVAAAVNTWARESADALKVKIQEEVENSVTKMGFVKRDEFDRLANEVAALTGKPVAKKSAKKSAKPTGSKPSAKKSAPKKSAPKKSAPGKVVKKAPAKKVEK
jgi:BMFP domain-containing protein YqiC